MQSKTPPTRCPNNDDLIQAGDGDALTLDYSQVELLSDLGYRRTLMEMNGARGEAGDILEGSYHVCGSIY
jgi:hypothetical protein